MIGKRIKVRLQGFHEVLRYGTIVECLTENASAMRSMFGVHVKAKMDDTGELEEFTYGYELVD